MSFDSKIYQIIRKLDFEDLALLSEYKRVPDAIAQVLRERTDSIKCFMSLEDYTRVEEEKSKCRAELGHIRAWLADTQTL